MDKKSLIAIVLVLVVVVSGAVIAVTSLNGGNNNSSNGGNNGPSDGGPVSSHYPITVNTVMNGGFADQTVTKVPERILVWESSTVELLCYFGLGDKIVGEYTTASPKRVCILPELQSAYDAVPKLDKNTYSIEQAIGLQPDVILGGNPHSPTRIWEPTTPGTLVDATASSPTGPPTLSMTMSASSR